MFEGEPALLPEWPEPTGRWVITAEEAGKVAAPPPPPVRHAKGYDEFVTFAAQYGTGAEGLFDFWAFAHFIRAHRERFGIDPSMTKSAIVFLGNVCIANHSECYWTGTGLHLAVESAQEFVDDEQGVHLEPADRRYLRISDTVPAILEANEERFLGFRSVADAWRPGAPVPHTRPQPYRHRDVARTDQ